MATAPQRMEQSELEYIFNSLKPKQSVSVWFNSAVRSADGWTELQVGRKSKSKKYNLEKISLINPKNPKGSKYYLYNRQGRISFAMGDMGTSLIAIKTNGKNAESHDFSQKSAEGDYEPRFYSLGERIGWMEFAVADENWYQYEDDYIDVVLDIEEWNENNANNSKLSNLVKQYISRYEDRSFFRAESFSADHPKFDPQKADRNKDGKISSWERTVGNEVAKSMAAEYDTWMIDSSKYEGHTPGPWIPHKQDFHGSIMIKKRDDYWMDIGQMKTTADKLLAADAPKILYGYKKQMEVLTTLDEKIRNGESHADLMKALEQGLGLPETWKEMGAESFSADERKLVQLVVEYYLPGDPEYINDILTEANMKIIRVKNASSDFMLMSHWDKRLGGAYGDKGKFIELLVEYYLPGDPEYIYDLLEGANMKIIEMKDYYGAESFSADDQTRHYKNLGIGAALVAGLAYWFKR